MAPGQSKIPHLLAAACFFGAGWLAACAADPSARRTRRAMNEQEEIEIGRAAARQVEEYIGLSGGEELDGYLARIGQRLAKHSSRSDLAYEFHVVDMKEPNAFALPGGYIYVSRGLLALMNVEDELAAVLGHEIAHVAARHSARREAKSRPWVPLQILAGLGGAAASVASPRLGSMVAGVGQLPASLVLASYSRKQEEEADRLGQRYAAAAGWDPAALASTMDTLTREQQLEGGRDPNRLSFFDSHPTTPDRAREARAYASTLTVAAADRIAENRPAFLRLLDGLVLGVSVRNGVFLDEQFIHPELRFGMRFPRGWQYANSASAVVAQPADKSAVVALQLAAEGDDPGPVADEVERQIPFIERSGPIRIHGMPAMTAIARAQHEGRDLLVFLAWIAKDGLVYQVLGAAPPSRWDAHRPIFEATARSFRPLTTEELREIPEDRLRLVTSRSGETISDLVLRTESQWSAPRVAVANAMDSNAKLPDGQLIKISKSERYRP